VGNAGLNLLRDKVKKYGGTIMASKIIIDNDECLVCEACVEICPSVFGFDQESGTAFVIEGSDQDDDCVDEAIAACPGECINREE